MQPTIILCPLYQDEAAFHVFADSVRQTGGFYAFVVVNDGTPHLSLHTTLPLTILHLHRNIGHQKAIAVGLAYACGKMDFNRIVVMDCDGEDRPEDIGSLLDLSEKSGATVVARRRERQEGRGFRFFYLLYKAMFFLLTGRRISFGNFMVLPKKDAEKLIHYSEVWNHLAGAIIKSGITYKQLDIRRGKRYAGQSKMSFSALFLHGLGAIGVFTERIAIRLLIFSLLMIALSVLAIGVILSIRFFTTLAIPGWATTAFSSMLIVLLQSFLLSLFTIFLYHSSQSQQKAIPARHFEDYIASVETT